MLDDGHFVDGVLAVGGGGLLCRSCLLCSGFCHSFLDAIRLLASSSLLCRDRSLFRGLRGSCGGFSRSHYNKSGR